VIYGSVCSGVEAATVAWHPLGWKPKWFSEIEAFPSAVLAHHYPHVPNLGDMTAFKEWPNEPIDLLVGGTPCQSFSIAGLRKGLDDPRGNLMLTYVAIAARYKPRWLVWENVPGVLSSNGGRDFGSLLTALGQIGYGFAYRICDAQYFGVAQRRRRVFVVGYLGDWRRAAAVLFERDSLSGHPAPSREAREDAAGYTATSFGKYSEGVGTVRAAGGDLGGGSETLHVAQCLTTRTGSAYDPTTETLPVTTSISVQDAAQGHLLPAVAWSIMPMNSGKDYKARVTDVAQPLMARGPVGGNQGGDFIQGSAVRRLTPAVAFAQNQAGEVREGQVFNTLNTNSNASGRNMPLLRDSMTVRRLTPTECERLQGFPDDYTMIPYRNRMAADGPRYKAMGNSMAVPVMRWIGQRINEVDKIK